MPDVIVIGAGISGLTCAYRLKHAGKSVLVLEQSAQSGGKILTEEVDGYLIESGPNSMRLENKETSDLFAELGLAERLLDASMAAKSSFVLKHAEWVKVPRGPAMITTPLLSVSGKLAMFRDFFCRRSTREDESVRQFFTRHFGSEMFAYTIDPMVSGIYAGDADKLSTRYAFPKQWAFDRKRGSFIRVLMWNLAARAMRFPTFFPFTLFLPSLRGTPKRPRPKIVSLPDGLSEIILPMERALNGHILQDEVLSVDPRGEGYIVRTKTASYEAPIVVLATDALSASALVRELSPALSASLASIEYPPIAIAYLGYAEKQFESLPNGFGGLIPSSEGRSILGVLFSSSLFPGRAPEGHVLLTVLAGGARHSEIADWSNEQILQNAEREIAQLLKIHGPPTFRHARLWKHAIPQYNVGYGAVLAAIDQAERNHAGLHLLCNYRGGISMGSCIQNATELANRLV